MTDQRDDAPEQRQGTSDVRDRELEVAREIAGCLLTASTQVEVYRLALGRAAPIVGASFASVFVRDPEDHALLRLVCAHNWPQPAARYLGTLRIRDGRGPTGRAVQEGRAVEVQDVFAEPALRDWWEPARELGFVSMIALPLATGGRPFGALSFYFSEPRTFDEEARALLQIVAHQLATTGEHARLVGVSRPAPAPDPGSR